jgi:tRNA (guanine-N7-)-methyltransferase
MSDIENTNTNPSSDHSNNKGNRRPIRSFVLRPGRMTVGQQNAMDRCWPAKGLSLADGPMDCTGAFGRKASNVLEIGFGMGASLLTMAEAQPEVNFVGIEVHPPGVGSLLLACDERGVENIRVYREDAVEVLKQCIVDASLDGIQLYFPDPWPKKKHQKRRIVQPDFVSLLGQKLKPGGFFHMATDWQNYAEYMVMVMADQPQLRNRAGVGGYSPRPEWRPKTKFEMRGERLGHGVWDLLFEKVELSPS